MEDLNTLVAAGRKLHAIYADPPWAFEVHSGKGIRPHPPTRAHHAALRAAVGGVGRSDDLGPAEASPRSAMTPYVDRDNQSLATNVRNPPQPCEACIDW